jgi:hypothetical protein
MLSRLRLYFHTVIFYKPLEGEKNVLNQMLTIVFIGIIFQPLILIPVSRLKNQFFSLSTHLNLNSIYNENMMLQIHSNISLRLACHLRDVFQ